MAAKVTTAEWMLTRFSISIVVVDMFVAVDVECEWCNNLTISYEVICIEADGCMDMMPALRLNLSREKYRVRMGRVPVYWGCSHRKIKKYEQR